MLEPFYQGFSKGGAMAYGFNNFDTLSYYRYSFAKMYRENQILAEKANVRESSKGERKCLRQMML